MATMFHERERCCSTYPMSYLNAGAKRSEGTHPRRSSDAR